MVLTLFMHEAACSVVSVDEIYISSNCMQEVDETLSMGRACHLALIVGDR
jgi:hypothetical protein